MASILKIVRLFSVIFTIFLITNIALSSSNLFIQPVSASKLNINTVPSNGNTITGNYTFKADDQGDASRCELYIDGMLVSFMAVGSGGWDWETTVGTYAWPDGWHVVRFDSIGGATGNDSKSIFVKFDNIAPAVTNVQTIYPSGQTASKPGDTVTIVATVTESTSGIFEVKCDTSYISTTTITMMYDDGNHLDGLSGDGTYGTPLVTVTNDLIGYHPVYINASDNAGNYELNPGEVGIDTIDPSIEDVTVVYPDGQFSAKDGDKVRITAYINDEDPNVDIVLDIDRSGSMGWTEDRSWLYQDIDISQYADNGNQLQVRFSYQTDFSWQFSGWNVDDLLLTSDQNSAGFFSANFENTIGNNNWVGSGGEWERGVIPQGLGGSGNGGPDPTAAHGGSRIIGVDVTGNGNYGAVTGPHYITSPVMSASSETGVHLKFYRWLNADYPGTAPDYKPTSFSGDEHLIEVKNSTAGSWNTVWDNKQQKMEDGKDAAKILINHQGSNDRSALYSFGWNVSSPGNEVTRNQDWTSNKTMILNAVASLNAYGGTPLWDSIVQAANYAGTSETLKALVVLTDGSDTGSTNRLSDAVQAVRNNEVPTFAIAVGTNSTEDQLKAVANAYPGGSYYYAASSDQLDEIYQDISQAIETIRFPKGAILTYVNATELGGLSKVLMYDDGLHDDFLPNDNIYGSELITIKTAGATGNILYSVNVEDVAARTDTSIGSVLVDNSMISITNSSVLYPDNKTNVRDGEEVVIVANLTDPIGIFPPVPPNGILKVYLDALNIGSSSTVEMYDDGNHSDNASDDGLFGSESITVTTGFSMGTFIVTLYAEDNASNVASQQLNVKVDNSGPTSCNLIWPIDNMTLEDTVKVLASAYDDAGIHRVEIRIAGSTIWDTMSFNVGTGLYEIYFDTKTVSDGGPYNIEVRAYDNSGEDPAYDSTSFGFFVDNTDPVLNINAPRNGDFVEGLYTINVSYVDPGLFEPTVEYKIDNTEWLSLESSMSPYWTASWNTSAEQDGLHTIYFRANDSIGNSIQYSVEVYIDNNPPTCSIVAPVFDEYIQDRYTFKILATDAVGVKSVTITFMDENHTAIYNPQNGYYEYTIDTILIEEGARKIDAAAVDLVGKTAVADMVVFHIDNSAPRITINYPPPGGFVSGEVFIDVTSSDVYLAITEYKIDGMKWISTAIPWDTAKVLDGVHTIDIRSYDLLNHETTEKMVVTVDNHDPTIEIHSPSFNQFVEDTFTFKITAWDYIGVDKVELTFFNKSVYATLNTQTNYYEYTFSSRLYGDGTYDIQATVFDLSGKSVSTDTIDFFIDNYYPELVLVAPTSGEIIKGDLKVEVLSNDTFLDSIEYRIDKGGYVDIMTLWNSETLADGEHTITVRAMDEAGHETTLEFPITVDNNAPELAFVTPTANTFYSGYMNVRVSAFDSVGVDEVLIRLDDDKDSLEIFRSPETGLYETSINTEDLNDGDHSIYAEVYDKNGHVSSRKLEFKTDNTGPDIEIISPDELGFGEIIFTFNVTDINGVKMVLLNIDSSGWREITLAKQVDVDIGDGVVTEVSSFNYIWTTIPDDNGKHFYVVKAIDAFGNEEVESKDILIENIVIIKKEEPDYLKMINQALPLAVFITALVIIILLIFLFYRGVLHRWYSGGMRRAEQHQLEHGTGAGRKVKRRKMKKRSGGDFGDEDFDDDSRGNGFDDHDDEPEDSAFDDDYPPPPAWGGRSGSARRAGGKPLKKGPKTQNRRGAGKNRSRPARAAKRRAGFDRKAEGEEIDWD